jgi:hypothetical protein
MLHDALEERTGIGTHEDALVELAVESNRHVERDLRGADVVALLQTRVA